MNLKVESAKERGVRRRPINRLLAARFTTNLGIEYIHNKPGEMILLCWGNIDNIAHNESFV